MSTQHPTQADIIERIRRIDHEIRTCKNDPETRAALVELRAKLKQKNSAARNKRGPKTKFTTNSTK